MAASPISPARFAAALQDLPLSSLALKVAELRNSIAHLDYSNEQLAPFARDAADRDCVEAIEENEGVIARMNERIALVKAEVERRGASWRELGMVLSHDGDGDGDGGDVGAGGEAEGKLNGLGGAAGTLLNGGLDDEEARSGASRVEAAVPARHSAWTDGTFQTGTLAGGVVTADPRATQGQGRGQTRQGGTLGDEELRRRLEERMAIDETDEDGGGLHL